jgi:16S rRNA (cytidine1402-2'-O)-methyltransferase
MASLPESEPSSDGSAGRLGTLYMVATPIGNLEDITLRALRILGEVHLILAEDTRVTRKLLSRYDIHTPVASHHAHSSAPQVQRHVAALLAGRDVALVTDAGTPGISDPGDALVAAAIEVGAPVTPVPGPCAATAALSIGASPGSRFAFDGFPPRGRSDRRAFFEALRNESRAIVLYEAPQRVASTLSELATALGDRSVTVARELTKLHETVYRGTLDDASRAFAGDGARGEFVIIVHSPARRQSPIPSDDAVAEHVRAAAGTGLTTAEAAKLVVRDTGLSRAEAYRQVVRARSGEPR